MAAGGAAGQERAAVRVTAHASCGRLEAAFGGRLNSKAGLRRAPQRGGGCGWAGGLRSAAVRLCFPGFRTGPGCVVGRRCCLWSPSVLCPTPRMRLTEADRSGGIKPDHTLLWSSRVRPDTTGPACLGKPRIRGVGPRTQPLSMVRRIHRTTDQPNPPRPVAKATARPCSRPTCREHRPTDTRPT